MRPALLLLALGGALAAPAHAFLPPPPPSVPEPSSATAASRCWNGAWRSLGLLGTAAITLLPCPLPAPAANGGGISTLNEFLTSVRTVKEELQGDAVTDLRRIQRALDVEAVTASVDASLDAQMGKLDQSAIISKRKVRPSVAPCLACAFWVCIIIQSVQSNPSQTHTQIHTGGGQGLAPSLVGCRGGGGHVAGVSAPHGGFADEEGKCCVY